MMLHIFIWIWIVKRLHFFSFLNFSFFQLNHYQKINKYKRKYRWNIFIGKFLRDFTDGNILSVYTDRITVGKKFKTNKKKDDVSFLPTEIPTKNSIGKIPR